LDVVDRFRLDSKVAVVTGASSGLGAVFALALAEAGADIVLAARRADRLEGAARAICGLGRRALPVTTDVSDPDQARRLVDRAMECFGRVDILVNNAGVASAVPATHETPDQFREVIDINLHGAYWVAQACGRIMRPGSVIINISSVLGLTTTGLPQAAYSASKSGLIGLTRDLARQWGTRKGIRVNAVAPGLFQTDMTTEYDAGYMEGLSQRIVLGRAGDPEELAATVIWLASDGSSYVTGQTIAVDGGITIT
jgi:NAD(P)-dependent dehydrogenase (short-subunit alcohol dehydrogenase family)